MSGISTAYPLSYSVIGKDNGRIASDVQDHERSRGPLDETNDMDQGTIAGFLRDKDPEKNEVLRRAILHDKQQEPAIITCDGFLINGNRRKLVIDKLHADFPNEPEYEYMKVVLLPAADEEGGAPTLLEIERLENRYQLQSDGRSEYYGFDRALSIKRKIEIGLSLRDQLRRRSEVRNCHGTRTSEGGQGTRTRVPRTIRRD